MDICENCGTSYSEIVESGFVGCEKCYSNITNLQVAIDKMYDGRKHRGRTAIGGGHEAL